MDNKEAIRILMETKNDADSHVDGGSYFNLSTDGYLDEAIELAILALSINDKSK